LILSHGSPSITLVDAKGGAVVGNIDLGCALEQAQSDCQGKLYVAIEDQNQIAVVDMKTMKVITKYPLGDMCDGPASLGLDAKNHILFAMCHSGNCVILNADDGKILATLPIGSGTDGGGSNPNTMEAFSSQGDGTLSIIKEKSPAEFVAEQTVQTKTGGKTCSLDTKNMSSSLSALNARRRPPRPPCRRSIRTRLPVASVAAVGAVAPATLTSSLWGIKPLDCPQPPGLCGWAVFSCWLVLRLKRAPTRDRRVVSTRACSHPIVVPRRLRTMLFRRKLSWLENPHGNCFCPGGLPGSLAYMGAARKPEQRVLKIAECLHLPAAPLADRRKQPCPVVRVGLIKNRQPLVAGKADVAEGVHQFHQVVHGKDRLGTGLQFPQVHQRLANAAFAARADQFGQRQLASRRVEMAFRPQPDEFGSADNLNFLWHKKQFWLW